MGRVVRQRILRWIVPVAACAASILGSTHANVPETRPDEPAFDEAHRALEVPLPPQARPGTGMLGVLSPKALDAVILTFTLPDGRVLRARRQQIVEDHPRQLKSWVGTFEEQP